MNRSGPSCNTQQMFKITLTVERARTASCGPRAGGYETGQVRLTGRFICTESESPSLGRRSRLNWRSLQEESLCVGIICC